MESKPFTRTMYHAHIEQQSRIKTTDITEITRLYQKDFRNVGSTYVDVVIPKGELNSLMADAYVYDITLINDTTGKIQTLIWSASFIIRGVAHNVD